MKVLFGGEGSCSIERVLKTIQWDLPENSTNLWLQVCAFEAAFPDPGNVIHKHRACPILHCFLELDYLRIR